jgi:DNA-binding response OmpR family regulator
MAAPSFAAHMLDSSEPSTEVRRRRARVLVIDDEIAIGRSVQRLLARDHDVTIESDPRQGVALAESGSWDVIFCDLMMPGMTGMDVYENLARSSPQVARRVIFMTAGSFSPRSWEFLESTANLHLTKPFDSTGLRRLVHEFLERATQADAVHEVQTAGE